MIKKYNLLFLMILLLLIQNLIFSQTEGKKISIATYRKIYSHVLKEERTIAVSLPSGYKTLNRQYPVLYILDAEYSSFTSSIGIVRYLGQYRIPEMIIVGVLNTNRNRDFWSYKIEGLRQTTDDGGQNFLSFFSEELIPFIDKNYKTTPYRIIYGRSAGGHFVTNALISKPDLFEGYLASSPVIGFSNNILLKRAENFFRKQKSLPKSYFIYYGKTDYNSVVERIPVLASIIRKYTPSDFNWGIKCVDGRHGPPESLLELLLMIFPDWQPVGQPDITPIKGEFLYGESIFAEIAYERDPVHFTLDGQEPTRNSPIYKGPLRIDKSTTLKAKAIRGDLQEGITVTAQFTLVKKNRPSLKIKNLKSGLKYKYVEKQIFHCPDYSADSSIKSGIVPVIDLGVREREQFYLMQFEGFINIPTSGRIRFTIISNGSKIFIDDRCVLSGDGLTPEKNVIDICLESGYHSILIICCILTEPTHILEIYWQGPGIKKQLIPETAFYHE